MLRKRYATLEADLCLRVSVPQREAGRPGFIWWEGWRCWWESRESDVSWWLWLRLARLVVEGGREEYMIWEERREAVGLKVEERLLGERLLEERGGWECLEEKAEETGDEAIVGVLLLRLGLLVVILLMVGVVGLEVEVWGDDDAWGGREGEEISRDSRVKRWSWDEDRNQERRIDLIFWWWGGDGRLEVMSWEGDEGMMSWGSWWWGWWVGWESVSGLGSLIDDDRLVFLVLGWMAREEDDDERGGEEREDWDGRWLGWWLRLLVLKRGSVMVRSLLLLPTDKSFKPISSVVEADDGSREGNRIDCCCWWWWWWDESEEALEEVLSFESDLEMKVIEDWWWSWVVGNSPWLGLLTVSMMMMKWVDWWWWIDLQLK